MPESNPFAELAATDQSELVADAARKIARKPRAALVSDGLHEGPLQRVDRR